MVEACQLAPNALFLAIRDKWTAQIYQMWHILALRARPVPKSKQEAGPWQGGTCYELVILVTLGQK